MKKETETEVKKSQKNFSPKFFETENNSFLGKIQIFVHHITSWIETIICLLLIAGIAVAFAGIPDQFSKVAFFKAYALPELIEYLVYIIIAIEIIHVIASQNIDSVIEILILAFTRTLVIREWEMKELLLGTICIAGLFAIKKFLSGKNK